MTTAFRPDILEEFRRLSDGDPELRAHGAHYSCTYLLDMQDLVFLVRMDRGVVRDLVTDPPRGTPHDFAIRGDAETWREFRRGAPAAADGVLWAAALPSGMRMEGNLRLLMHHLRCVARQLELLRATVPPE